MVVTFKYSVNEYNRMGSDKYIKLGYTDSQLKFEDGAAVVDGDLAGIILNQEVMSPLPSDMLEPYFEYRDGCYQKVKEPRKKVNTAKLRKELYENGFQCGGIHYIRWKRSAGSARVGKALFIDSNLYPLMHQWEMCGIHIDSEEEIDLAALESYISLTTSSIIDTLELNPKHILVIDDFESVFSDDVVSVEEQDGKLTSTRKIMPICNSIWDGQGLIDRSAMGAYQDKGMVLLRNSFFKCCCFNTNLQQWFADNHITRIDQLNGKTEAERIEDIKLVTTPSSIKYIKFGTLEDWRRYAGSTFGVVKHDKKTHFFDGRMVQTHYQLLNTLKMTKAEVEAFLQPTLDYITMLKTDPAVVRYHVKYPIEDTDEYDITPSQSKNDVVYRLLGLNDRFADTKLYDDFVKDIVKSMLKSVRLGHVLVNGNYSTLLGNPLEMLKASVGQFDGGASLGAGEVHTTRFEYGRRVLCSRSPHITMSNVWIPTNVESPEIDAYFNLTPEIICINSIGDNVLQRLSGCDFDSDSVLVTDNDKLIEAGLKTYLSFPIAACNVSAQKIKRRYCSEEQTALDIKTSRNLIGAIINTSQELNTIIWDKLNSGADMEEIMPVYLDVCKLNAAQGIEIDRAKKEFIVDNERELSDIRRKYNMTDDKDRKIKPAFFAAKDKGKGYYDPIKKNYAPHHTTMDYLQQVVNSYVYRFRYMKKSKFYPFTYLLATDLYYPSKVSQSKVEATIRTIQDSINEENMIFSSDMEPADKYRLAAEHRQECIDRIGSMSFGASTMIEILTVLCQEENKKLRRKAMNILFGYPNASFFQVLAQSRESFPVLEEAEGGDILLYDFRFKKA